MLVEAVETDVLLSLTLADGDATKFPRAIIYNDAGSAVDTIDLIHRAGGHYQGTFTAANNLTLGSFSINYIVYNDAGHTVVANKYDRVSEDLRIQTPVGGFV